MASLKDVSAYANVNISTISRYLSNELNVRPETERRILDAIEKTGYQPNYIARALKTHSTASIGVIAPSASNPLFAEIVSGIDLVLREQEYTYFLVTTDNDVQRELAGIRTMQSKFADGVILLNASATFPVFRSWLDSGLIREQPMVFVNCMFDSKGYACVLNNFAQGSYAAVKYLIEQGRKKIAMITGRVGQEESDLKRDGYLQALCEAGLPAEEGMILPGAYYFAGGYRMAERLIETHNPDAIFAANDLMAIAAMRCAAKHGRVVPDDIAVVGYGNSEASEFTTPALSTIDQQKRYSGQRAAVLLLEQFQTGRRQTERIDTAFLLRESC